MIFLILMIGVIPFEGWITEPSQLEINRLVDYEFSNRQDAQVKLIKMGEKAVPDLIWVVTNENLMKDKDFSLRICFILNAYVSDIRPTKYDKLPWLDCLPKNYPNREKIIKDIMYDEWYEDFDKFSEGPGGFLGFRYGTEQLIIELLKKRTPRYKIISLLDEMVEIEKEWIYLGGRYKNPDFIKKKFNNG